MIFSDPEDSLNFILYMNPCEVMNMIFSPLEAMPWKKKMDSGEELTPGQKIERRSHMTRQKQKRNKHGVVVRAEKWTKKPFRSYLEALKAGGDWMNQFTQAGTPKTSSQCNMALIHNPKDLAFETKIAVTLCWLCGCPIHKSQPADCEHILPALRATMLVGLFTNDEGALERIEKAQGKDGMELWTRGTTDNYLWAHKQCNMAKSGKVLLEYDDEEGKFKYDVDKGQALAVIIRDVVKENNFLVKPYRGKATDCYKQITVENKVTRQN